MAILSAGRARAVERSRRQKDEFLRSSHESPIPHDQRHDFRGLRYWEYDPMYRVSARLRRFPNPDTIVMETSKGTAAEYHRYGTLEFRIGRKRLELMAYRSVQAHGHDSLFVPFRDATSGKETYGAGRYLDLELRSDDAYTLDFNLAYSPYCAYSDNYVCPFPPPENWLPVPISAGEKSYK